MDSAAMTSSTTSNTSQNERVECPCHNFTALSKIVEILDSRDEVDCLLAWMRGEVDETAVSQSKLLSCGKRSRCRFRFGLSFAILNDIRDSCRPYLDTSSSRIPEEAEDSISTLEGKTISYEDAFPSLSAKLKDPTPATPHPAAANFLVPPKDSAGWKQTTTSTATVNTLVGKKKGKRRIRPQLAAPVASVNSVWGHQSVPVAHSGSSKENIISTTPPQNPVPLVHHMPPPRRKAPTIITLDTKPKQLSDPIPKQLDENKQATALDSSTMPTKEAPQEHLHHLAEIYVALAKNLLISSTALEIHLLLRLLTLDSDAPRNIESDQMSNQGFFRPIFSSPKRCNEFAKIALSGLENMLQNLPLSLLDSLVKCQPFRSACPDLCDNLSGEIQYRHKHGILVDTPSDSVTGPHAILNLPFDKERDSRHNYRTQVEVTMYKNREETRDAFLYQVRSFMSTKGRVLKPEELEKTQDRLQAESKKILSGVLSGNMGWFADFFCDLLLQIGLSPVEETDQELLDIADRDRLQRLHKRFSSRNPHANRSSKKLVLPQKKESASLSPFAEALAFFQGYQECFFLFTYAGNNYTFGVNLKACLVLRILDLLKNQSTNQFERRLAELQLLSRFLGFLVFSPNWRGNELDSSKFKTMGLSNGINQLESIGLPIASHIEQSWIGGYAIITVPWVVELLKMAKWDSQTQTSRNFRQILANLRQIQAATFSTGVSNDGRFGPSMLLVNFFLETLFKHTPSLPSSLPQGSLSDADKLEVDCLDFEYIGFSAATFFASNPHVEDISNLIEGLNRIPVGKSSNKSRKLRPSVISVSPITVASDAFQDEVSDNKSLSGEWRASESPDSTDANPVDKVKTKLSEAFFHQHRNLKEICEFTIDRVLKNTTEGLLRNCITNTIKNKEFMDGYIENDIDVVQKEVFDLSVKVLRQHLEESVKRSFEILGPPDIHPRVLAIAISLGVDKGVQAGKALLHALITAELPLIVSTVNRENVTRKDEQHLAHSSSSLEAVDDICRQLEIACQHISIPIHQRSAKDIAQSLSEAVPAVDSFYTSLGDRLPTERELRALFVFVLRLDRVANSFVDWARALEESQSKSVLFPFLEVTTLLCDVTNFVPKQAATTSGERDTILKSVLDMTSSIDGEGRVSLLYEALKISKDSLKKKTDLGLLSDLSRTISEGILNP